MSIKFAEIESLTQTRQGSFYKPRVLADTTNAFFTGPGDRGIWKINISSDTIKSVIAIGTPGRRITQSLAGVQGENPSWTPDGKYLYINTPEGLIKRVKIYLEYN